MAAKEDSPDKSSPASPPSPSASDATVSALKDKGAAPKDRRCPFCHQSFTSSSLGRHLDTFIRPRNPKAPDGVHNVTEIRSIRGSITRRHTRRLSDSRHAGVKRPHPSPSPAPPSQPANEPVVPEPSLPQPAQPRIVPPKDLLPHAPTFQPEPQLPQPQIPQPALSQHHMPIPKARWMATGVINNLPPRTAPAPVSREFSNPRLDAQSAGKSPPLPHTATEEGRHAQAAELALKETVHAVLNAASELRKATLCDFDPLALNFPALCLRLLSPPPTLFSSTPHATATSWPIDDLPSLAEVKKMKQALETRISEHQREIQHRPGEGSVNDTDGVSQDHQRYFDHLDQIFAQWTQFSEPQQQHIWRLEIMRAFTEEAKQKKQTEAQLDQAKHEIAQLKAQLSSAALSAPLHVSQQLIKRLLERDPGLAEWDADGLVAKWRSSVPSYGPRPGPAQPPPQNALYRQSMMSPNTACSSHNSATQNGTPQSSDADVHMRDGSGLTNSQDGAG